MSDEKEHDLHDYMRQVSGEIQSEYYRIQKRATEDPGTAGDNGEENWAATLRKWLPSNYRVVTKGRLINAKGLCSPQVDVIVLYPWYPEALVQKKEYLEAGVAAAFECKLTLRAKHIDDAMSKATARREFPSTMRWHTASRTNESYFLWTGRSFAQLEFHDEKAMDKVNSLLGDAVAKHNAHPANRIAAICVADLACWTAGVAIIAGPGLRSYFSHVRSTNLHEHGGEIIAVYHPAHRSSTPLARSSPIFTLIRKLWIHLAWQDAPLQQLAQYFEKVEGSGAIAVAEGRWPITILSPALAKKLSTSDSLATHGSRWNEWMMGF